jgi:hypothetical protein
MAAPHLPGRIFPLSLRDLAANPNGNISILCIFFAHGLLHNQQYPLCQDFLWCNLVFMIQGPHILVCFESYLNTLKIETFEDGNVHNVWDGSLIKIKPKVVTSIPVSDLFPRSTITSISDSFSPICVHAWNYFQGSNQCKCMAWLNVTSYYSLHGNGCNLFTEIMVYND